MGRKLKVERIVVGPLYTNCYIVSNHNEAIIIDPGGEAEKISRIIDSKGLKVTAIIATHGHFDHILAVEDLRKRYRAPFAINKKDLWLVRIAHRVAGGYGIMGEEISDPDADLAEGSVVRIGDEELRVIETPGHTPGSVCLVGEDLVFTGDTLFRGSVGRTDFPGGSWADLMESLKKIATLNEDLIVYPGHGPPSTIGDEKRSNPFLKMILGNCLLYTSPSPRDS